MQKSYKDLAKYYYLFFQQKDYKSEADFIIEAAEKYKIEMESILDVGCGIGTHLSLFESHFKDLYGIDLNKEILKIAKEKVRKGIFKCAEMSTFKVKKSSI